MRPVAVLRRARARFPRRSAPPSDSGRFEQLAARLEQHTVNLAEHQAQLRDEGLRRIVNEVRANSAFLADSVIALERAESRRADLTHALVRPAVHQVLGSAVGPRHVVLVDHIDGVLVEELVALNHRVTIVDPALDQPLPPSVAINMTPIEKFTPPEKPVDLIVWVVRGEASENALVHMSTWLERQGRCVVACRSEYVQNGVLRSEERRTFTNRPDGRYVLVTDGAKADVYVHVLSRAD